MKILRPKKLVVQKEEVRQEETKPKKTRVVDDDEYPDLIDKKELVLSDKIKLVFSVARGGEYGLPMIDVRTYVIKGEEDIPTKKGIRLPLEMLYDFMEILEDIDTECDEKGIE